MSYYHRVSQTEPYIYIDTHTHTYTHTHTHTHNTHTHTHTRHHIEIQELAESSDILFAKGRAQSTRTLRAWARRGLHNLT